MCPLLGKLLDVATNCRGTHLGAGLCPAHQRPSPRLVPRRPATAARLLRAIGGALGSTGLLLEHAGSTSVPGLAAKPVIDLVLGVPDPVDEAAYVPALEALGYQLRIREPEWQEHRLLAGAHPTVNLHVFAVGSGEIDRMLAFRDHLRRDSADRELYVRTKRELASRTWAHVQDYADAKSRVVEEILRRAPAVERGDGEVAR
jgi:GrpB-like predicted nucleotidyltransferase (UPF0157 family)